MNQITFRQATISDIPEILELIKRSKSYFHRSKEQYVNDFIKIWGPGAYYVEDHFLYMAFYNGEAAGIIGMRAPGSKRAFVELDLLFVDSNYIGKGFGRLLWEKVLSISKEQHWKSFRFISDNIPQITGFYEHMGARKIDRLTLEIGDFPIMEYQLSD